MIKYVRKKYDLGSNIGADDISLNSEYSIQRVNLPLGDYKRTRAINGACAFIFVRFYLQEWTLYATGGRANLFARQK